MADAKITADSNKETTKKSLKSKVADFINDTVTLDTITLTGPIKLVAEADVNAAAAKGKEVFKWDKIFEKVAKELKTDKSTEVSIVAYTHAEWDQDSVNYVAKDADVKLVEAHGKTVAAAHEARMNALKAAVDVVDKIF